MSPLAIHILNGPNLNLLGIRNVAVYGSETFESYFLQLKERYSSPLLELYYFQSNHEGSLIDKIHELGFDANTAIILNAGGYTHTSIALRDAIEAVEAPCIEVHISDIYNREYFRSKSYLTEVCHASIIGKGLPGYATAIELLLADKLEDTI